jgi:uncharacterized membrane protein YkoI
MRSVTAVLAVGMVLAAAASGRADKDARVTLDAVPAAVKATILKAAGGAPIKEIEKETENGKVVFEAEFVRDGKKTEVEVDAAGKLLSTEVEISLDDVPAAVKATILKAAGGAKIAEVEKEIANGVTTYEAEFVADGKEVEITVAADGKLLEREVEDDADDDDDDDGDDDDDDEDEEEVSIDQVPAAVKATILREAKGAAIKEIEKETKNGKTVYEAEFVVGGKEIEIKVSADGTLLKREVEDDDDD